MVYFDLQGFWNPTTHFLIPTFVIVVSTVTRARPWGTRRSTDFGPWRVSSWCAFGSAVAGRNIEGSKSHVSILLGSKYFSSPHRMKGCFFECPFSFLSADISVSCLARKTEILRIWNIHSLHWSCLSRFLLTPKGFYFPQDFSGLHRERWFRPSNHFSSYSIKDFNLLM